MPSSPSISTQPLRVLCLALIVIALLASALALLQRVRAEHSANAVELVLDYNEVTELAGLTGMPVSRVLDSMKRNGVTAIALQEETLQTLLDQGLIGAFEAILGNTVVYYGGGSKIGASVNTGIRHTQPIIGEVMDRFRGGDDSFTFDVNDRDIQLFVEDGLNRAGSKDNLFITNDTKGQYFQVDIHGQPGGVKDVGLGLLPVKVKQIQQAGLRIIPRLHGSSDITSRSIQKRLTAVANLLGEPKPGKPRGIVIFEGTIIPGYRALIPQLSDDLQRLGLVYGAVEFTKQKGDVELGSKLNGRLVRVHSISQDELNTLKQQQVEQRFALAVKDRNIRVLYAHLPQLASADPLIAAGDFVRGIYREITKEGFTVSTGSPAHPFDTLALSRSLRALIYAGAGAGFLFWLLTLLPAALPRSTVRVLWILTGVGLLGALGTTVVLESLGRAIFGLLAAIAFPLLALTWSYRTLERMTAERPARALGRAVGALIIATGITLLGALMVAATMAESRFLVKVGQFAGVKLALALPLLIFGVIIITDGVARQGETLAAYGARCKAALSRFLAQPLYLWGAVATLIGLVALAVLLSRSGNEGVGVSSAELQFRSLLEQALVARPRTKEFLFGHPLFLLGMVAGARGWRFTALLLMLGGAIGQVDVLNTYCHAHTPVLLSLLRTANGLWIGIIIGIVLTAIVFRRSATTAPSEIEDKPVAG